MKYVLQMSAWFSGELLLGVADAQHLAGRCVQPLRWSQAAGRGRLRPAPMMDELCLLFLSFPPSPGQRGSPPNTEKPQPVHARFSLTLFHIWVILIQHGRLIQTHLRLSLASVPPEKQICFKCLRFFPLWLIILTGLSGDSLTLGNHSKRVCTLLAACVFGKQQQLLIRMVWGVFCFSFLNVFHHKSAGNLLLMYRHNSYLGEKNPIQTKALMCTHHRSSVSNCTDLGTEGLFFGVFFLNITTF